MANFIDLPDETWQRIRYEYEETKRPVADICAEHGFSAGTLRHRVRYWNWTPRWKGRVPRKGPPPMVVKLIEHRPLESQQSECAAGAFPIQTPTPTPDHVGGSLLPLSGGGSPADVPDAPHAACPAGEIPPYGTGPGFARDAKAADPATMVPGLQSALAGVLPAIEATLAKLTAATAQPREIAENARALGNLTRVLRELKGTLEQYKLAGAAAAGDDDPPPEDIDEFRNELARRIDALVASEHAQIPARYEAAWREFATEAQQAPAGAITPAPPRG
jgi:hypothetical protein